MKRCKHCHSTKVVKAGTYRNKKGRYQIWHCNNCGTSKKGGKLREECRETVRRRR